MKITRSNRGRSQVNRYLWFGDEYDDQGYFKLVTYAGCYLAALRLLVGGDEQTIGISASLLWRTMSLHLYLPAWRWKLPDWPRETGFSLVWFRGDFGFWDIPLSIDLWNDDSSYSRQDHKKWPWNGHGWHWYFHPWRWIPGDARYERDETATRTEAVTVSMPEGDYPAVYVAKRVRWQRPRWFTAPWLWRCEIEVEQGVAMPGKGENSWDCGDDATYSIAFAVEPEPIPPVEAARRFAADVGATRQKRGWAA